MGHERDTHCGAYKVQESTRKVETRLTSGIDAILLNPPVLLHFMKREYETLPWSFAALLAVGLMAAVKLGGEALLFILR